MADTWMGKKHADGRRMYSSEDLVEIVKQIEKKNPGRALQIYKRALNVSVRRRGLPLGSCFADVLGCIYDDAGFWWRKTKIKV